MQERLTILDLSKDALIEIARGVPLPQSIDVLHTKFRELKLSEYQPVVHVCFCDAKYIERVFNQKRSRITIRAPFYYNITTSVLKEFKSNASLTSIDLSKNRLHPEDANHIAEGFAVSASLTNIDLCCNGLGPEGATHTAKGISASASLTNIDLSNNNFTEFGKDMIGVNALAKAIKSSASLTSIDLGKISLVMKAPGTSRRASQSAPR